MTVTVTVTCTIADRVGELAVHEIYNQEGEWTTDEAVSWVNRHESEGEWVYHSHKNAD